MNLATLGLLFVAGIALTLDDTGRIARPRLRAIVYTAAGAIVAVLAAVQAREEPAFDLSAFYCAGRAVLAHEDPSLIASLAACEHNVVAFGVAALPAPQPGYDLALFALIAPLRFAGAQTLWTIGIVVALALAALAMRRITSIPASAAFASFVLGAGYTSIDLGQIGAYMVALIAFAAYGIARNKPVIAGVAAAGTMVEPHLGLPVALAAFLFVPKTRLAIVATGAAFAALSLAALGVAGNIEYFARELPLHALAESANADQYSVPMLAHWFGWSDRASSLAGSISYAVMAVAGIVLGLRSARALGQPGLIVAVPAAAITFGGAYVHYSQLAIALPAALLLAASPGRIVRACGAAATVLLALQWETSAYGQLQICAFVIVFALTGAIVVRPSLRVRAATACLMLGIYVGALWLIGHVPAEAHRIAAPVAVYERRVARDADFASAAWGGYLYADRAHAYSSPQRLAHKVPAWIALVLVLVAALTASILETGAAGRLSNGAGWKS